MNRDPFPFRRHNRLGIVALLLLSAASAAVMIAGLDWLARQAAHALGAA